MLPKIIAPTHPVTLFSLKKPVSIRPYLVAEEKLFLTASQTGDPKDVEAAVKQVIRNVTNNAVDVDKLPSFDLEYLFLQMRARSVNNIIEVPFNCNNELPSTGEQSTAKCGGSMVVRVDIDDIKLVVPAGHTTKFMITDDIGIQFKYPTYETMQRLEAADLNDRLQVSTLMAEVMESVFTKAGEVHEVSEQTPEELDRFVDSLSLGQVEVLRVFFETMPRVTHSFTFKCPTCGYTEDVVLQGMMDFFD